VGARAGISPIHKAGAEWEKCWYFYLLEVGAGFLGAFLEWSRNRNVFSLGAGAGKHRPTPKRWFDALIREANLDQIHLRPNPTRPMAWSLYLSSEPYCEQFQQQIRIHIRLDPD